MGRVFYSFIPLLSVFFVSQEGLSFVESNQQMFDFYKRVYLKSKDIVDLCKVNFCISKLSIQCYRGSGCVLVTVGVNIYLYVSVGLFVPVCPISACV